MAALKNKDTNTTSWEPLLKIPWNGDVLVAGEKTHKGLTEEKLISTGFCPTGIPPFPYFAVDFNSQYPKVGIVRRGWNQQPKL